MSDKQKELLKLVSAASDKAANLTEFNTLVGIVETRAATELPTGEQTTVLVVTSTAKASAAYWSAHAQEWAVLVGNAPKTNAKNGVVTANDEGGDGVNWWKFAAKCLIADAGGALGGLIGAAVSSGVEAAIELIGD